MSYKTLLLFIALASPALICAQSYKRIATIPAEADLFTSDNQSNIYVVRKDELIKYNKLGRELYRYSNKNLGDISYVDASNMLKVLVYYKDFSQAIFLDNTLSLNMEPVSFDKLGYQQVSLACSSHNNAMWIYNQQNFALIQLNTSYEQVQQTGNLSAILSVELQPAELVEYDNKLYLNNPSGGILVFDIYGTYFKTIPAKKVRHFQPIRDLVYYMPEGESGLRAYDIKTTEEKQFAMPQKDFINFRLGIDILMLQDENGITVYAAE